MKLSKTLIIEIIIFILVVIVGLFLYLNREKLGFNADTPGGDDPYVARTGEFCGPLKPLVSFNKQTPDYVFTEPTKEQIQEAIMNNRLIELQLKCENPSSIDEKRECEELLQEQTKKALKDAKKQLAILVWKLFRNKTVERFDTQPFDYMKYQDASYKITKPAIGYSIAGNFVSTTGKQLPYEFAVSFGDNSIESGAFVKSCDAGKNHERFLGTMQKSTLSFTGSIRMNDSSKVSFTHSEEFPLYVRLSGSF